MKIYRQGDVLLVAVSGLSKDSKESEIRPDGKLVLAYGEVTGHHHRVEQAGSRARLWDAGAERFLQVMETVALEHEEHAPVTLDPGIYRVIIQSEYTPAALRNVAD